MKKIAYVLSAVFRNLGIEDKIKLHSIQGEWRNLFSEPLSLHTYPIDLNDKELTINVDSPAWLDQLKFFRQEILRKLQHHGISNIRLKHGRVYYKKAKSLELRVQSKNQNSRVLTHSESAWIEQTIAGINDADLKEGIRKAIEKSLR